MEIFEQVISTVIVNVTRLLLEEELDYSQEIGYHVHIFGLGRVKEEK